MHKTQSRKDYCKISQARSFAVKHLKIFQKREITCPGEETRRNRPKRRDLSARRGEWASLSQFIQRHVAKHLQDAPAWEAMTDYICGEEEDKIFAKDCIWCVTSLIL